MMKFDLVLILLIYLIRLGIFYKNKKKKKKNNKNLKKNKKIIKKNNKKIITKNKKINCWLNQKVKFQMKKNQYNKKVKLHKKKNLQNKRVKKVKNQLRKKVKSKN